MLRYIFISLFFISLFPLMGQTETGKWESSRGFSLGVNVSGPINKIFDKDRSGISFISRMSVKNQLIFLAEAGYENISFENSCYNYSSNGSFLKAGLEYDVFGEKEMGSNDNLLFGLHYGLAVQEHSSSQFVIENVYWGGYSGRMGAYTTSTHWIELSGGPRMELFKNFYMGWVFQIKVALYRNNPDIMLPYLIPGFGNGDNSINAGFSYTLEYMIPWKKGRVK